MAVSQWGLSVFRFPFSVFRFPPLSRRSHSGGYWGAGVPPLLGALPLVAYWGALKVFNYSLLVTHYSLIESFPLSVFRFPFSRRCYGATILGALGALEVRGRQIDN